MTQDDILDMFRTYAETLQPAADAPALSAVILDLAQMLAESRGKLSKENFETLICIGGALYREGKSGFDARSDLADIMKRSAEP